MNCSEARLLATQKLSGSLDLETEGQLERHFNTCEVCGLAWFVLGVAQAWEDENRRLPGKVDPAAFATIMGLSPSSGYSLIHDQPPVGAPDSGSIKWLAVLPAEAVFLRTRRPVLREVVVVMDQFAAETGSEFLAASLSALRGHIRWADDLAVRAGVPSECVYPPPWSKTFGEN